MRRNCNLELRFISPVSSSLCFSGYTSSTNEQMLDIINASTKEDDNNQQLKIFYNRKMAVCDVTELKARKIIFLASRERSKDAYSSWIQHQQLHSPTGLSMKKSLQRFLHNRNNKKHATSISPT